jgi:uncharacterized protein YjdB
MKMKKWTGLLVLGMLIFSATNIKVVKAIETSSTINSNEINISTTTPEKTYSVDLAKSSIKTISSDYVNPMYKGLDKPLPNYSTFKSAPSLAGTSGETFSTVNEASSYFRQQMVNRASVISFTINKPYYDGIDKNIFDLAVAESNSSGSSQGDYLYAHFSSYSLSGYSSSSQTMLQFQMEYLSDYNQEQAVNSTVQSVLSSLNVYGKDDYTKTKAVHDYIVQNINYDYSLQKYSAYNAIVEKDVVCQGFASLTYKMLKDLGVGVRFISGMGNGGKHAWNIVKINGQWYNVDNTWDENGTSGSNISYEFFLKNNSDFIDHIRDPEYDGSFNKSYPMAIASYVYGSTPVTPVATGISVSSISLNTTSLNLQVGSAGKFITSILPSNASNKEVLWKSSNTNVATVATDGTIKAVGAGTATITCTANDGSGQVATGTVTVTEATVKVTSIRLNQRNLNWVIGKTGILTATLSPSKATNKEVIWESSDINVATVDANGNVTAIGVGTATITCTASDGSNKSATCTVKVTDGKVKVESLRLNQRNLNWVIGKTGRIAATLSPSKATNKEVIWESSDINVATVDANGNVTAIGVGTATITCTAKDGSNKSAICTIKVTDGKVKVESLRLNQRNLDWIIGKTGRLTATVSPSKATNKEVIWESSDINVATVDANGNVTAIGAGTATITCTAKDGSNKSATCTITVTN